jgi:hypothetical protein
MPLEDLALDLEGDQEEEEDHQAFVDPQDERFVDDKDTDAHADRRVVNHVVHPGQRRVDDNERQAEGGEGERAAWPPERQLAAGQGTRSGRT